jgi:hypothetical protein
MSDLTAVLARLDALESKEAISGLMVSYMAATDSLADKGARSPSCSPRTVAGRASARTVTPAGPRSAATR